MQPVFRNMNEPRELNEQDTHQNKHVEYSHVMHQARHKILQHLHQNRQQVPQYMHQPGHSTYQNMHKFSLSHPNIMHTLRQDISPNTHQSKQLALLHDIHSPRHSFHKELQPHGQHGQNIHRHGQLRAEIITQTVDNNMHQLRQVTDQNVFRTGHLGNYDINQTGQPRTLNMEQNRERILHYVAYKMQPIPHYMHPRIPTLDQNTHASMQPIHQAMSSHKQHVHQNMQTITKLAPLVIQKPVQTIDHNLNQLKHSISRNINRQRQQVSRNTNQQPQLVPRNRNQPRHGSPHDLHRTTEGVYLYMNQPTLPETLGIHEAKKQVPRSMQRPNQTVPQNISQPRQVLPNSIQQPRLPVPPNISQPRLLFTQSMLQPRYPASVCTHGSEQGKRCASLQRQQFIHPAALCVPLVQSIPVHRPPQQQQQTYQGTKSEETEQNHMLRHQHHQSLKQQEPIPHVPQQILPCSLSLPIMACDMLSISNPIVSVPLKKIQVCVTYSKPVAPYPVLPLNTVMLHCPTNMLPRLQADHHHEKQSLGEDVKLADENILRTKDDPHNGNISYRTECNTKVSTRAKCMNHENSDTTGPNPSKLILVVRGTTYFVSKPRQKQLRRSSSRTDWQQTLPR